MSIPASLQGKTVAILGGTGQMGRGLGKRFSEAGIPVVVGSRDTARAEAAAAALKGARGLLNPDAAQAADIVVVAVPWDAHAEFLRGLHAPLRNKVVIDCVNPLEFDRHGAVPAHVWEGSAVQQAQVLLNESAVIGAFHTMPAHLLQQDGDVDADVLVIGDDEEAVTLVKDLAGTIPGVRGIFAGWHRNAQQVEALVANLIAINLSSTTATDSDVHATIKITGV